MIPVAIKTVLLRPRTERVLRITAVDDAKGRRIELSGDANAPVSKVLLVTSHQLLPDKVDAWDDD